VLAKAEFIFDVSGGVANHNLEESYTPGLYPNPSAGQLSILNDEQVREISFYNITGEELGTLRHVPGMSHDISQFDAGVYFVEIRDKNNRFIRTQKLFKHD